MTFEIIFFGIFGLVVASFAWRYFRNGSLTGALLGGKITREIGQASLSSGTVSSQNLKVNVLESSSGESFVGLSLVSKAPMAASMVPVKLSRPQAQELIQLLQQAVAHQ